MQLAAVKMADILAPSIILPGLLPANHMQQQLAASHPAEEAMDVCTDAHTHAGTQSQNHTGPQTPYSPSATGLISVSKCYNPVESLNPELQQRLSEALARIRIARAAAGADNQDPISPHDLHSIEHLQQQLLAHLRQQLQQPGDGQEQDAVAAAVVANADGSSGNGGFLDLDELLRDPANLQQLLQQLHMAGPSNTNISQQQQRSFQDHAAPAATAKGQSMHNGQPDSGAQQPNVAGSDREGDNSAQPASSAQQAAAAWLAGKTTAPSTDAAGAGAAPAAAVAATKLAAPGAPDMAATAGSKHLQVAVESPRKPEGVNSQTRLMLLSPGTMLSPTANIEELKGCCEALMMLGALSNPSGGSGLMNILDGKSLGKALNPFSSSSAGGYGAAGVNKPPMGRGGGRAGRCSSGRGGKDTAAATTGQQQRRQAKRGGMDEGNGNQPVAAKKPRVQQQRNSDDGVQDDDQFSVPAAGNIQQGLGGPEDFEAQAPALPQGPAAQGQSFAAADSQQDLQDGNGAAQQGLGGELGRGKRQRKPQRWGEQMLLLDKLVDEELKGTGAEGSAGGDWGGDAAAASKQQQQPAQLSLLLQGGADAEADFNEEDDDSYDAEADADAFADLDDLEDDEPDARVIMRGTSSKRRKSATDAVNEAAAAGHSGSGHARRRLSEGQRQQQHKRKTKRANKPLYDSADGDATYGPSRDYSTSSNFLGVSKKRSGKWQAAVRFGHDGAYAFWNCYSCPRVAARARDAAALALRGPSAARLNFPEESYSNEEILSAAAAILSKHPHLQLEHPLLHGMSVADIVDSGNDGDAAAAAGAAAGFAGDAAATPGEAATNMQASDGAAAAADEQLQQAATANGKRRSVGEDLAPPAADSYGNMTGLATAAAPNSTAVAAAALTMPAPRQRARKRTYQTRQQQQGTSVQQQQHDELELAAIPAGLTANPGIAEPTTAPTDGVVSPLASAGGDIQMDEDPGAAAIAAAAAAADTAAALFSRAFDLAALVVFGPAAATEQPVGSFTAEELAAAAAAMSCRMPAGVAGQQQMLEGLLAQLLASQQQQQLGEEAGQQEQQEVVQQVEQQLPPQHGVLANHRMQVAEQHVVATTATEGAREPGGEPHQLQLLQQQPQLPADPPSSLNQRHPLVQQDVLLVQDGQQGQQQQVHMITNSAVNMIVPAVGQPATVNPAGAAQQNGAAVAHDTGSAQPEPGMEFFL